VRSATFVRWPAGLAAQREGHFGLFSVVDWLPTLLRLVGGSTAPNLPLDGYDIWPALQTGGTASPRTEVPVNIAACGPDANGTDSIIRGPQAAIIVGDLKLIVPCFWRSSRNTHGAALFNLTADMAEEHDLAAERPDDVTRLVARLAYWETLSVPPYALQGIDRECGQGTPHGQPAAWYPWC